MFPLLVKFTFTSSYPKTPPKLEIETSEGLSETDLKELSRNVNETSKSFIGEVMCHEIVNHVQIFIENNCQKKPQTFYEVMKKREMKEMSLFQNILEDTSDKQQRIHYPIEQIKPCSALIENDLSDNRNFASYLEVATDKNIRKKKELDKAINHQMKTEKTKNTLNGPNKWLALSDDDEDSKDNQNNISTDLNKNKNSIPNSNNNSRYYQEFREISLIGNGAFGEVWKVRNNLDRRIYAVKKISFNKADALSLKTRREVTTISRLVHKHIVRYVFIINYAYRKNHL